MTEIIVRALDEDAWAEYRAIRLAALKESPEAFVATHEEESASSASAGPAPRRTTPASSSACG